MLGIKSRKQLMAVPVIKIDADQKFKWTDFKLQPPLSDAVNKQVKFAVSTKYDNVIQYRLNAYKLAPCSKRVFMAGQLLFNNDSGMIDNPLFGLYDIEDKKRRIEESGLSEKLQFNIDYIFEMSGAKLLLEAKNDIESVKKKFRECANQKLFIVPLVVTPIKDMSLGQVSSHQNILVIAKNRGTVYWIEPETIQGINYQNAMIRSIKELVTTIGMVDPTVIIPSGTCPQGIVNDKNCMFWSLVIFELIMLNPDERDHSVLIQKFLQKYPTNEALNGYINGFKYVIKGLFGIAGGKKRVSRTRKSMYKRRDTKKIR